MNINTKLESLKSALQDALSGVSIEIFSRDIAQYKFLSQEPVGLITLAGTDFEKPLHKSIDVQKATLDLNFYYLCRSLDDSSIQVLSDFADAVSALDDIEMKYLKVHSHNKDVQIFEIKASLTTLL